MPDIAKILSKEWFSSISTNTFLILRSVLFISSPVGLMTSMDGVGHTVHTGHHLNKYNYSTASFTAHMDRPSQVSACRLPSSARGGVARLTVFHSAVHPDSDLSSPRKT